MSLASETARMIRSWVDSMVVVGSLSILIGLAPLVPTLSAPLVLLLLYVLTMAQIQLQPVSWILIRWLF